MTFTALPMPILETERLILRGWKPEDIECVHAVFSHEENAKYIGGTKERWQSWRHMAMIMGHWNLRGFTEFVIETKDTGTTIGFAGPWFPEGWPEPEIGYSLVPDAHGQGFATEAAIAGLKFAYEQLGWTTAISMIDEHNDGSKHVARKMGAIFEKRSVLFDKPAEIWRHLPPKQFLEKQSPPKARVV